MPEFVPGVFIILGCGLAFTGYCVVYILRMAYMELEDGSDDTPESEELLQLPSDRDQQSSGRGHD